MKLNLKNLSLIATSLLLSVFANAAKYEVVSHQINWEGKKPASSHVGELTAKSIEVDVSKTGKVKALNAVIDMNSIESTDLEGEWKAKLEGHLKGDDFFAVDAHPTASFVLDSYDGENFNGKLSIRDIEHEISVPVEISTSSDGSIKINGSFEFNRYDYGVKYQKGLVGLAKDKLINKMIKVDVQLELAKQ